MFGIFKSVGCIIKIIIVIAVLVLIVYLYKKYWLGT